MQDYYNIEGFYSKSQKPQTRSFASTRRSSFSRSMPTTRSIPTTSSFSASRSTPVTKSIPKTSSFSRSAISRKVEDDKKLEYKKRRHSHDRTYYSHTLGGTGGSPYWGWTYWNYYPLYPLLDYLPMFPIGPAEIISDRIIPFNEDIRDEDNNEIRDKKENKKEVKKSNESDSSKKSEDKIENFTLINLLLNILK